MEKEIKQWLNSEQDYEAGLRLLMKYTRKRALVANLGRKKIPKKLQYELRKLAGVKKPMQPVKQKKSKTPTPPKPPEANTERESLPEDKQELYDKTVEMYKKARGIHAKLKEMEGHTDKARAPYVKELKELDVNIRQNWAIIDGKVDDKSDGKGESDGPITPKRISSNRKYISTQRKALQKGRIKDENVEKVKEQLSIRAKELRAAGENIKPEVLDELKALGIEV